MSDALKVERETYKRELPNLLDRAGQFALIKGAELAGVWLTRAAALNEGYRRFGLTGFMVRQIRATEPVWLLRPTMVNLCPACMEMSPMTVPL